MWLLAGNKSYKTRIALTLGLSSLGGQNGEITALMFDVR